MSRSVRRRGVPCNLALAPRPQLGAADLGAAVPAEGGAGAGRAPLVSVERAPLECSQLGLHSKQAAQAARVPERCCSDHRCANAGRPNAPQLHPGAQLLSIPLAGHAKHLRGSAGAAKRRTSRHRYRAECKHATRSAAGTALWDAAVSGVRPPWHILVWGDHLDIRHGGVAVQKLLDLALQAAQGGAGAGAVSFQGWPLPPIRTPNTKLSNPLLKQKRAQNVPGKCSLCKQRNGEESAGAGVSAAGGRARGAQRGCSAAEQRH